MKLIDFAVLFVVAVMVAAVALYIYRAKKKGVRCIGCPDSAACSGGCSGKCASCPGCNRQTQG